MEKKSNKHTNVKLCDVAEVFSGVYAKSNPAGDILCLQVKDLMMPSPETTAARIEFTPKLSDYIIKKGDLLFAGKGTTYLCKVFDLDIKAVPSTTLYSIRLHSNDIMPEYLCWYLNHPNVVAVIKSAQAGSVTPLIHKPTLENLNITIPDIEMQKRIVDLSNLQKREEQLLKKIAEKRVQITNQILINELIKY